MDDIAKELADLEIHATRLRDLGQGWSALSEPKHERRNWGVMFPPATGQAYARAFDLVFPSIPKNPWASTARGGAIGTFLRRNDEEEILRVREFVNALDNVVVIQDSLSFSLALDYYRSSQNKTRTWSYTEVGELVRQAKYGSDHNEDAVDKLCHRLHADELTRVIGCCTSVAAVPGSSVTHPNTLPARLAAAFSMALQVPDRTSAIRKLSDTRQIKNLSRENKLAAISGSIEVSSGDLADVDTLLLVDDVYQSGTVMNYVGQLLISGGVHRVIGFAAVKTMRNDDNVSR